MKRIRSLLALLLCALLVTGLGAAAQAEGPKPYLIDVRVGEVTLSMRAYSESYEGNVYLSLNDLAQALRGTEKQFCVEYRAGGADGELWELTTGKPAPAETGEKTGAPFALSYLNLKRNRLFVDGGERRYYSYRSDEKELYLSLADLQLLLDLTIWVDSAGVLRVEPDKPFAPDLYELKGEDYFSAFNAVLVGDADTGEIFFSDRRAWRCPIASVSKLMSYLLLAEAVRDGEVNADDEVTISTKAARLSWTADGVISLSPGDKIPLRELTEAMMLASSNECALALAEHVAGTEEDFVARMNERAAELGLRQNMMSAYDMFSLCAYLLENFPEITEITEKQFVHMEKLGFTTANSNPLVFNMPGVNGLKTGSTNRAGYCVVASLPVTVGEETHTLVAVVLGAETADVRGQCAEILLRAAKAHYEEEGFAPAA